jgi:hypothetical protein
VRGVGRIPPLVATAVGATLFGLGIVYLVVACDALPGFMGPTPGDTSPRTGLGVAGLVLGSAALSIAALLARRQSHHH